jgi:IS30 family transposase
VISREIERNGIDKGWMQKKRYSAKLADKKEKERRRKANFKHRKLIKDPKMLKGFRKVFKKKHKSQGVDEIIGSLRNLGIEMVCTSTMYDFIHSCKKEWEYMLRYGKHGYKKRN